MTSILPTSATSLDVERAVRDRYRVAAGEREAALCCPVDYDSRYLEVIPKEVLERDYGCGDPSRYVRAGDTVLDLGSGGGKICFIAAQIVGEKGNVIGVDMNDEMLELAASASLEVGERLGFSNVSFKRGRIQDLQLDANLLDAWLDRQPVKSVEDIAALEEATSRLRREAPMIPDASVDIVVSNCVLNLVRQEDKPQLIREIFRVLKVGGRIAISDIVSDEVVPADLQAEPELWSGCISGAFQEQELLREMEAAGFHGIAIDTWADEAFRVVRGIEFRSVTVTAHKSEVGPSFEANQAVIYRGPWKQVEDDDGNVLRRGERTAVCAKTYQLLTAEPYADMMIPVPPHTEISDAERVTFDSSRAASRHPREAKGVEYAATTEASGCCEPGNSC